MSFEWPLALVGLILVPLALAGYVLAQRRRVRYTVRFTNLELLAAVAERSPGWRRHVPAALALGALTVLLAGLARPHAVISVPREEGTVILTMDTSGSMNAEDVDPTRMVAARAAAQAFVEKLPKDFRVGVVAFASGTDVVARPTSDREIVSAAIDSLTADGGTALGEALSVSLDIGEAELSRRAKRRQAEQTETRPRRRENLPLVILLLSDGKQTEGLVEPIEAATRARDLGVPVFTIALGTDSGIVRITDEFGYTQTIPVPPDRPTLRRVAEETHAEAFDAPDEKNLNRVYDELSSRVGYRDEEREVTYLFTAAGALLLLSGAALSALWFNRIP